MRSIAAMCAAAVLAAGAGAQEAGPEQAGPCAGEAYEAFDFWVGTWEVSTPDGQRAGVNRISREEGGCLILERWTNLNGGTGQSYNFHDPQTGGWRQIWVSAGLVVDMAGGLTEVGAMRMEGRASYHGGATADFWGEWRPQADGSVIQHFEQRNPESGEFEPWFTGVYRPLEEDVADG